MHVKNYRFNNYGGHDPHRWITYFVENIKFLNRIFDLGFKKIDSAILKLAKRLLGMLLIWLFPKYTVFNNVFLFKRDDNVN
jgi:hypothetical protein